MGGSPVPNAAPGLQVTPASAPGPQQRGGRGRGQHYNAHHSPGHFQQYTQYPPNMYNPYANSYNNGYAYASSQYNILPPPQYAQNGALPQGYAHAYQQHFYTQQQLPPQQFYNASPIPQYPGPQSPSFSMSYQQPPQSIVSVPPIVPPPLPTTPASHHSLHSTPIPMAQPMHQPPEAPAPNTFSPGPAIPQEVAPQPDPHVKTPEAPPAPAPAAPTSTLQDLPPSPALSPIDPRPETIAHRVSHLCSLPA